MKKYKGFSLIEVLLLFAALSVILAATAPIVTRSHKNFPTKLTHGFYQCYRDENNDLHEEWFNTYGKRVDTNGNNTVDSCNFQPPAEATLFKITLIGGGSGGYAHAEVEEHMEVLAREWYDMDTGYEVFYNNGEKDSFIPLTLEQMNKIFGNEPMVIVGHKAGDGGWGQGVRQYFTPTSLLSCQGDSSSTDPGDISDWSSEDEAEYWEAKKNYLMEQATDESIIALLDSYSSLTKTDAWQTGNMDLLNKACLLAGYEGAMENITREEDTNGDFTSYLQNDYYVEQRGGYSGKGHRPAYTYNIRTKDYSYSNTLESYQAYLKKVANAYERGSSTGASSDTMTTKPVGYVKDDSSKIKDGEPQKENGKYITEYKPEYPGIYNNPYFLRRGPADDSYQADDNNNAGPDKNIHNKNSLITPKDGTDAQGYSVVKWTDPIINKVTYRTSYPVATGGKASNVIFGGESYIYNVTLYSPDFTARSDFTPEDINDVTPWSEDFGYDSYQPTWKPEKNAPENGTESGPILDYRGLYDVIPKGYLFIHGLVKYYNLGMAGNPGKVATFTKTSMGNAKCNITIGQGTKGHKESSAQRAEATKRRESLSDYQFYLNNRTVVSCSGFKLSAEGGDEVYSVKRFRWLPDGKNQEVTEPHTVEVKAALAKPSFTYAFPNFWLKLVNGNIATDISTKDFGKAGDGSAIDDYCTWGRRKQTFGVYTNKNTWNSEYYYIQRGEFTTYGDNNTPIPNTTNVLCTANDYVAKDKNQGADDANVIEAGDGHGGAVFIRW